MNVFDKVSVVLSKEDKTKYAGIILAVSNDTTPVYSVSVLASGNVVKGTQAELSIVKISN